MERLNEMARRHKLTKARKNRLRYGRLKMRGAEQKLWEVPDWTTSDLVKVTT